MKSSLSALDLRSSSQDIRGTGAYTIIELMVSIVIFTIGFLGAYLLIDSASNLSARSKEEVIGGNILREQAELLKNLRDSNWIQYKKWNSVESAKDPSIETDMVFGSGFYTIENNFSDTKPVSITKLHGFLGNQTEVLAAMKTGTPKILLCTDSLDRYGHTCSPSDKKTRFASFFQIEPLTTRDTSSTITVADSFKVTLFFISNDRRYRAYTMSTIITDWKK